MLQIRKIVAVGVFLTAIFVMVEISYRIYAVGPVAINPFKANSLNTLMRSEFVQLSEYPEIFFELKADMDGWFKGVRFTTNSQGFADDEYSLTKPDGGFRVLAAGSSWTMPSGVVREDAWHAVLERQLGSRLASRDVEVINLGVELYGLRELVATVRHKAADWNPDLIVVAVTTFTTSFRWDEVDGEQRLPPRAYPALESYAYRGLSRMAGWSIDKPADDRPRIGAEDAELRLQQLRRAIAELAELRSASRVPIVIMFLGFVPLGNGIEPALREYAAQEGINLVFANRIFPDESAERGQFRISRFDRHPNAAGHRLIAEYLEGQLAEQGLLPDSGSGSRLPGK